MVAGGGSKEAAASPPDLKELIAAVLPDIAKRGRGSIYRSTLRANVKSIDPAKRGFGDKDEWKAALKVLQEAGMLSFSEVTDTVTLPAPEEGPAAPEVPVVEAALPVVGGGDGIASGG